MSKKLISVMVTLVLLASLAIVTSVLSQSAKTESKSVAPPTCICSDVSILTISDDAFLKAGVDKDEIEEIKEDGRNEVGAIFNCQCGKTQCVVSGIHYRSQSNSVSCVKGSLF